MKKISAFTLAEVLITLGIIGVVAALTMPLLIQKYQEKIIANQLKEFYSVFSQALLTAQTEQGDYSRSHILIYDYIKPYLKIQKDCQRGPGCFTNTVIKLLDGRDWINLDPYIGYHKFILNNGASVQMFSSWSSPGIRDNEAEIRVDINGFKGPNTLGRDIFKFKIIDGKLIPSGAVNEMERPFETSCNRKSSADYNGDGCTAWVLYNENMDYLHCDDLSWNGKHKCK